MSRLSQFVCLTALSCGLSLVLFGSFRIYEALEAGATPVLVGTPQEITATFSHLLATPIDNLTVQPAYSELESQPRAGPESQGRLEDKVSDASALPWVTAQSWPAAALEVSRLLKAGNASSLARTNHAFWQDVVARYRRTLHRTLVTGEP